MKRIKSKSDLLREWEIEYEKSYAKQIKLENNVKAAFIQLFPDHRRMFIGAKEGWKGLDFQVNVVWLDLSMKWYSEENDYLLRSALGGKGYVNDYFGDITYRYEFFKEDLMLTLKKLKMQRIINSL